MSDRSQDELRKRFNRTDRSQKDDDSSDTSDTSNPSKTDEMDETNKTDETDERSKTDGTRETGESQSQSSTDGEGLKERKQVAMYLPVHQREELVDLYEKLDARSKLADNGGIEKNREFYEGLISFVLDHREEFAATLGVEVDD